VVLSGSKLDSLADNPDDLASQGNRIWNFAEPAVTLPA
jgi:hypothetical protein